MKKAVWCFLSVILVFSCRNAGDERRMAQIIAEADSMNRNFVPMTSDTLLLEACRYYDRHGTPNQRMMAHYLLGCVYRDRGEAPHAIDCYMDAVSKADTTASDCDYHVLGCVYGQMADIYHQQLLLTNEIEAYKCVTHCFIRANDPILYAIRSKILMGGVYILLNKKDSAELITKDAIRQLEEAGYLQEALTASTSLMHLYVEQHGKTEELKHWIDRYDTECSFFDQHHALPPNLRQFYYYKGWYYESTNELDSAEYYYRKIYYPGMSFVAMDPMYRGLLSVFEKRHKADSIAKYARLYCMVNDSSIAVKDRETTARVEASYNYSNYQRLALDNEEKAIKTQRQLFVAIVAILLITIVTVLLLLRQKNKVERLQSEYASASDEYSRNIHRLQVLEETHKAVIAQIQGELDTVTSTLNERLEEEKRELTEENNHLKMRINELGQLLSLSASIRKRQQLSETPIVKRLTELCATPLQALTEDEKKTLLSVMSDYYPSLIRDLQQSSNPITPMGVFVCILVALNYRSGDIANLLGLSPQQVANLKQDINNVLFHIPTAKSLYKNLIQYYNIRINV